MTEQPYEYPAEVPNAFEVFILAGDTARAVHMRFNEREPEGLCGAVGKHAKDWVVRGERETLAAVTCVPCHEELELLDEESRHYADLSRGYARDR